MNLTGQILIAMPTMDDPRFEHAVVFLCDHSPEGAMGLIVNKPLEELSFDDLLGQIDIDPGPHARSIPVGYGGPCEPGRGFVLHSGGYTAEGGTMTVLPHWGMTASVEILSDLAAGQGPEQALLTLGYAGWGRGQLERELAENAWLTAPATDALLFSDKPETTWAQAIRTLGIDPHRLSGITGRA